MLRVPLVICCESRLAACFTQDALNEHYIKPGYSTQDKQPFNINGSRMTRIFNRTVNLALFPVSRFVTGHSYSVQKLHEVRYNSLLNICIISGDIFTPLALGLTPIENSIVTSLVLLIDDAQQHLVSIDMLTCSASRVYQRRTWTLGMTCIEVVRQFTAAQLGWWLGKKVVPYAHHLFFELRLWFCCRPAAIQYNSTTISIDGHAQVSRWLVRMTWCLTAGQEFDTICVSHYVCVRATTWQAHSLARSRSMARWWAGVLRWSQVPISGLTAASGTPTPYVTPPQPQSHPYPHPHPVGDKFWIISHCIYKIRCTLVQLSLRHTFEFICNHVA